MQIASWVWVWRFNSTTVYVDCIIGIGVTLSHQTIQDHTFHE